MRTFLEEQFIKVEPSAPYTQAQNGGAERSGGVIKEKSRAMRTSSKLPTSLWPEITRAAVYLHNRIPRYNYQWKAPYTLFHTFLSQRDGIVGAERKPEQAHLRVYGCKAFAMTTAAQKKSNRLDRLSPKAWIGYLIGYDSTNIYRIWNPVQNRVILTRDVIFNEEEVFPGQTQELMDELRHVNLEELAELLQQVAIPVGRDSDLQQVVITQLGGHTEEEELWDSDLPQVVITQLSGHTEEELQDSDLQQVVITQMGGHTEEEEILDSDLHKVVITPLSGHTEEEELSLITEEADVHEEERSGMDDQTEVEKGPLYTTGRFDSYPSPPTSPPAALLAATIAGGSNDQVNTLPSKVTTEKIWQAAFNAGRLVNKVGLFDGKEMNKAHTQRKTLTERRSILQRRLMSQQGVNRRELGPAPSRHDELDSHIMGELFRQAEVDHLKSHQEMRSWVEVDKSDPRAKGSQILDCMWVYVYKFNKHGKFLKCKARLVVRGDQQARSINESTYAATLAGRSFRVLMAIAARFDLELMQYDAVNAFVNAELQEDVFMRMPNGYRKPGKILKLQKALYGLRKSPLLWQREFTGTLRKLGFEPIPQEPCCFARDGILLFFYVDDIVLAYRKAQEETARLLINQLQRKYKLSGGEPLEWFLGIEVLRDRKQRLIWLSQSAYIDKIANLSETTGKMPTSPMKKEELLPFDGKASNISIQKYQRKIGSVLYAAVITRPDIAFATSRLSRFNMNPSAEHHESADQVLDYLKNTRSLALQLGGEDDFIVASDASFADNTLDRKSSQAYVMKLFGGVIGWRANKQSTVTTSTTEAELLALAQAAKEGIFVSRLIKALDVVLDNHKVKIQCDNTQTIRLVTEEMTKLQTRLRHVDIHNHWLRQEVFNKEIEVVYAPSGEMIADGLTKVLVHTAFQKFVDQLGLVDITVQLDEKRAQEMRSDPESSQWAEIQPDEESDSD